MGRLIYSAITSLDGYVVDADGRFDWAVPDEEVHAFVNGLERTVGTYLYGRRLYEVMAAWETMPTDARPADARPAEGSPADGDRRPVMLDYARIWQAADKVVYSTTLDGAATSRTRIERGFDPDAVRRLVASANGDVSIGGPTLAGHAIRAGLVDDWHLFLTPVVVGGGVRALPDGVRVQLELLATHRFASGVVHLHHRVTGTR
ncbi:dihydrofolate reductase family protein [Frankia sp. AiPs1]|uniref:dihydrofolate reductase family protein n=1 Tax=Frankia sp. AiPs1 TaxID=573493 RepID=UPI0020437A32|nr:dihydrofolate reductase family protein [Frankia sp. AiPs1]MCM3923946.1 dihydrofolate reductase family protein [Frankia sp. AiPs1]